MASPDRTRNNNVFPSTFLIPDQVPVTRTISQENRSTTTVRIAVATSESVFLIPHFARIAVIPAKNEEPTAKSTHIFPHLPRMFYLLRRYPAPPPYRFQDLGIFGIILNLFSNISNMAHNNVVINDIGFFPHNVIYLFLTKYSAWISC